jgi:hypothetical protein
VFQHLLAFAEGLTCVRCLGARSVTDSLDVPLDLYCGSTCTVTDSMHPGGRRSKRA